VPAACPGYTPSQIQTAYGLNALYNKGWDGTGQTIVIVDANGSNTILQDANTFSSAYGLPPLTSSNFQIYYPGGKTTCGKGCDGWNYETTLDVEWAHAVAPGADIALGTDAEGRLGEASRASVFVVAGGLVQTAPVAGLLPGIGRAVVLELAGGVLEDAAPAERWRRAQEIFVVSALRGVTGVAMIDGVPVGDGAPGPVTRRLAAAYRQCVLAAGRPEPPA